MATGFVRHLRAKYEAQELDDLEADTEVSIRVHKQLPLKQLRVVDLSNSGLMTAGGEFDIIQTCPNVRELEIGNTKIEDWAELMKIVGQLRALELLGIAGMPIREDTFCARESVFPNIKTLIIGGSHFSEANMSVIADTFPGVTNLVWTDSELPDLASVFPAKFGQLEMLNLSSSHVSAWEQIACLGTSTTLKALKLCKNPISEIPEFSGLFPALKQLNLEETLISSLHSLHHVNCFPALTDLRIHNTPLTQRFTDHSRMMLISYLPDIINLNGSKLTSKERLHSERGFVREFSMESGSNRHAEMDASEDNNPMIRYLAPEELPVNKVVFQRLFAIHGQVYKFAEINLAPPTEAKLHLQTEEGEQTTVAFPLQAKVKDVKAACEALFGVPVANMKLFYGDHEMLQVMGLEVLRFDNKTIGSYKMKDDDIIIVARKDSVN